MGLHDLAPEQIRVQVIWDQIHELFPRFSEVKGLEEDVLLESYIKRSALGFMAYLQDNWDYEEQVVGGWESTYIGALESLLRHIKGYVGE